MLSDSTTETYERAGDKKTPARGGASGPSGESAAAGPSNGRDPRTGQFVEGNSVALKHGGRSERLTERLQQEARAELSERRRAISEDLGGALSTIQADLLERYLVAVALMTWMEDRLLAEGVVTAKGKRRAMYSAYAAQLDRVVRIAQVLGVDRKARQVPSLADVLERGGDA